MSRHNSLMSSPGGRSQQSRRAALRFGDLKVRPKLMILHNIFFLVLASAVYFALIPPFERSVEEAAARERGLLSRMLAHGEPASGMQGIDYREGAAEELGLTPDIRQWLDANPGATLQPEAAPEYLYLKDPATGRYRMLRLPSAAYDRIVDRARWTLAGVLGAIYALAVLALELIIMPRYVYHPLRAMLDADRAAQEGDAPRELIPERDIPGDELGQIMRSRNATVAQLRRHEKELAEALARLEATDRLVSLGLLSAGVAHELNTPLTVLHGSIEKLMETAEDKHTQERLARMLRMTDRLRKIGESLLDFARPRGRETTAVPVRRVVEESWELVAIDEMSAGVRFTNAVAADHLVVGNPDRLIQVFVNLLRNALLAVKGSGMIEVHSRVLTGSGRTWISVMVDDNGPGIPPDMLPQIFEAFVTSRLDARGTGLGLTVAEGIVRQHGGAIEAVNRPGGGARLEVTLPAASNEVIA